jgi:predicted DNA-binding transcriptional regulator YafY
LTLYNRFEMYDPSMRVLTILEILQAKGRVTASELAARLEVSSRTVQRYIARLQDLGVPVTSTRGRGAEYRLKSGFRMPPILFSNEEAFAVALGLSALQHLGLTALAPAVVGVETKLASSFARRRNSNWPFEAFQSAPCRFFNGMSLNLSPVGASLTSALMEKAPAKLAICLLR